MPLVVVISTTWSLLGLPWNGEAVLQLFRKFCTFGSTFIASDPVDVSPTENVLWCVPSATAHASLSQPPHQQLQVICSLL